MQFKGIQLVECPPDIILVYQMLNNVKTIDYKIENDSFSRVSPRTES